jgi:isopenicillin N synthase-like dioxygenase
VIPAIDLRAFIDGSTVEREAIANEVDETCRNIGFLIVEGHDVPNEVVDAAWSAARQFFDLSLEDKLATKSADPGCPRGYFPVEEETLAKTRGEASPPDPKEAFSSGPYEPPAGHEDADNFDFFYGPNIWPTALPEFESAWLACYQAMEVLGAKVMSLLATALKLDDDYFVPFHSHHISALRGINYPAMPAAAGNSRAGAHSDYGSVTILRTDPDVGGLEVQTPGGDWLRIPAVANGFVVNIGDLMAHWTNGRWISTLHRVVAPDRGPVPRRQSIAYFMNPNYDARIQPLPNCAGTRDPGPAVTAGHYLVDKFRSAF